VRVVYSNIELADGVATHISEERVSGHQQVQVAQFLRGEYASPLGRGNRTHAFGFSVAYRQATLAMAMQFELELSAQLPDAGELRFEAGDAALTTQAVLEGIDLVRTGVLVRATYAFTSGRIAVESGSAPGLPPAISGGFARSGTTANRPADAPDGWPYLDTDLGFIMFRLRSAASGWINAMGAEE
jgi:hypothetical protein